MKRYYFELTDGNYNDLGAFIPDGYNKEVALLGRRRSGWQKTVLF